MLQIPHLAQMAGTSHSPPQENTGTAAVQELLSSVKMNLCPTDPSAHSPQPGEARDGSAWGGLTRLPPLHILPSLVPLRPCEPPGNKVWLDNPVIGYRTPQRSPQVT